MLRPPTVPLRMDDVTRAYIEDASRKFHITAAKTIGPKVRILGYSDTLWQTYHEMTVYKSSGDVTETAFSEGLGGVPILHALADLVTLGLYERTPSRRGFRQKERMHRHIASRYQDENWREVKEALRDLRIYLGPLEEAEKDLNYSLELVPTGKAETWITGNDMQSLCEEAVILGADAIIHYQQNRGKSFGTPVRKLNIQNRLQSAG